MSRNFDDFPSLDTKKKKKGEEPVEPTIPVFTELTATTLNLEAELLSQYNEARRLMFDAQYGTLPIPVNQRAQAVNTATSVLAALTKSQAELYSLERIKKIEACLLEVLKAFPELQDQFLVAYEAALEA